MRPVFFNVLAGALALVGGAAGQGAQNCSSGTYLNASQICNNCSEGEFQNEEGQTQCIYCVAGKYTNEAGSSACLGCGAGTHGTQAGFTVPEQCTACQEGTYQSQEGQTACNICGLGASAAAGSATCTDCTPGKFIGHGQYHSECKSCPLGKYVEGSGKSWCITCDDDRYQDQIAQTNCKGPPPGWGVKDTLTDTDNGKESYAEAVVNYEQCPPGKSSPGGYDGNGVPSCESCYVGTYQNESESTECNPCSAGTYQAFHGRSECSECDLGTFSDEEGQYNCEYCGYVNNQYGYQDEKGQPECKLCTGGSVGITKEDCTICQAGEYLDGNTCLSCSGLVYQDEIGQIGYSCKHCDPGTRPVADHSRCEACPANQYLYGYVEPYSCEDCPIGKYSDGITECDYCPMGQEGITGQSGCQACSAGKKGNQVSGTQYECVPCTREYGQYQDEEGQSECKNCPNGMGVNFNITACVLCDAGEYLNYDTGRTCDPCPINSYQVLTGQNFCYNCEPEKGSYQNSPGKTQCESCNVGYVYDSSTTPGVCTMCQRGTFWTSYYGDWQCLACEAGTYMGEDTLIPHIANEHGDAECTSCPNGLVSQAGATECTEAPRSTADDDNNDLEWIIPVAAVGGLTVIASIIFWYRNYFSTKKGFSARVGQLFF